MENSLASMATGLASDQLMQQISTSILKEIQDQMKSQANALLGMMQNAPSLNGTGTHVNIQA